MKRVHELLLRGSQVQVQDTKIKLPTLDKVFEMGPDRYYELLQSIVFDIGDIELVFKEDSQDFKDYEIFLFLISQEEALRNLFFEAIHFFTGEAFVFEKNYVASVRQVNDLDGNFKELEVNQLLTESYWLELRKTLRLAHWLPEPEKYDFTNDKARKLMEKIKKNQEKVRKLKERKGTGSSELYELIGATCSYSPSYNLLNVWDLTYYQFFDHYYRLTISDNYRFSMQSLLAGADPKKMKIEHWSSPIKHDNN